MSASFTITGFEVLEKLGEGGMAAVWKARQISLDRTVAIKILSDRLAADATDIDRFQTEARAAAKLKHPGIVQVYDASAEGGMYYFVMEYVAGYTVGEWVRRKGRLSEKEALLVAECVADALSYAWEREHIVHCDIKPDNIMVDADGTVKVADLGLARTISAMNADDDCDEVMGTPAYISPEQAQGLSDLDCRSDIYSLGATLYHLLTGKMLFEGHEQEEIMELQLTSTVPDPMDEVPSLSKGVCWLLERMLCKDRELRESAWEDVRRDIRRVSRGLLPQGKSIPDGASTIQRSQRRSVTAYQRQVRTQVVREATTTPVIKISVIGGLVALLLIIMVRGWLAHRSPPPVQAEPSIPEIRYIERNTEPVEREDPVERRARDMHEHARRYEEGHPDQIEAAIALYERVLAETQGTKYSLMAQTSVTRLNAARDRAARQVLDELQHRAEQLAASGDTQGAIALLRAYNGPYAEHTRRERGGLVTQISLHAQERERTDRERQEALVLARDHTLTALADQIAGQDLAGALLAVDHAASSFAEIAADPEWQSLRTVLRDAVQLDDRIINSFARQAGQTVTVEFNAGPRQVVVEAVEDGRVRCRQLVGSDRMIHSTVTFGLEQLALRERLQRMGSDDDMDVALVKGMLALEAEAFDHAVRFFEKTHALLAQRLVEATGDARQARAERLAESGLRDLLRFCGITVGDFSRAEWLRQVESHAFNPAHMEPIGAAVNAYLQAHGETDFAAAAKAILDVLRGRTDGQDHEPDVLPQPRGAPPGRHPGRRTSAAARQEIGTEAVLAALRAGNPQARPDAFVAEEENGVCVKLSINDSQVTNIDPVAGLSELKTVHFEGQPGALARLRSLRPIAQLPLESVAIRYAAIRDIYELRGMSLTYVDLTGSAVRDLNALRGSPVQELRVGAAPFAAAYRPVAA